MKTSIIKNIYVFLGVVAFVLVAGGIVLAQQEGGSGFSIQPVRIDMEIERGDTETEFVEVKNVTATDQKVVVVVNDFIPAEDESGTPVLITEETEDNPYSIRQFVLPIDEFTLKAGEKYDLPVTISIPEDASPGSYYGVVRLANVGNGSDDGTVNLSASVGTIFLVSVPGETVQSLTLEQISAARKTDDESFKLGSIFASAPDSIVVRLRNDGNTFVAPFGKVTITDWTGKIVQTYELNDTYPPGNVLPESIRRFADDVGDIGSFGRFKVEANLSYGEGGSIISATTAFWIIPWLQIAIILLVVIAIVFASTRGIKAYNNMVVKRSRGEKVKKN